MGVTGKKRKKRPSRGGRVKRGSGGNRDPPPVAADPSSPVGGVPIAAAATTNARLDPDPSELASVRDPPPVAADPSSPVGGVHIAADTSTNAGLYPDPSAPASSPAISPEVLKRFRHFLNEHCHEICNTLWETNSFAMPIRFSTIRPRHKKLSDDLVTHRKVMEAELHGAVVDYLKAEFMKKDFAGENLEQQITDNAKLILIDFPDSIEPFEDALAMAPGGLSRTLFAKQPKHYYCVPITTAIQLMFLISSLEYLLNTHKEGKSWDGAWKLKNWDIVDGQPRLFALVEPGDANQASCKRDLARYGTEILSLFAHIDGRYPANMESLFHELQNPLELPDHLFFGWYYEYLAFYPSFYTGSARMSFARGYYHLVEYLEYQKKIEYSEVFGSPVFWTERFTSGEYVHHVVRHAFWDGRQQIKSNVPYKDTLGHNFKLMRQVQEHAYRYLKLKKGVQTVERSDENDENEENDENDLKTQPKKVVQTVERSDENDLYWQDQYPWTLPAVIKTLFIKNKMVGEFLELWEEFKKLRGAPTKLGG